MRTNEAEAVASSHDGHENVERWTAVCREGTKQNNLPMATMLTGLTSLSVLTAILVATSTPASAQDDEAVQEAAARFYTALNTLFTGDAEPMKALWSHAEDVTYMGPMGGFQAGWSAVEKIWEDQAALKLGGNVEAVDMQITVGHDLAITHNYEIGENEGPDGEALSVSIRATNIFRKEDGEWKMIGHHTDVLPHLYGELEEGNEE
jgi:ketosteroid isomerase-like protein